MQEDVHTALIKSYELKAKMLGCEWEHSYFTACVEYDQIEFMIGELSVWICTPDHELTRMPLKHHAEVFDVFVKMIDLKKRSI